jgi:hypothetical protein
MTEASATAVSEVTSKASPSARRVRSVYVPYTRQCDPMRHSIRRLERQIPYFPVDVCKVMPYPIRTGWRLRH